MPSQRAALAWLPWASSMARLKMRAFGGFVQTRVGIRQFAALRGGEQFIRISLQGFFHGRRRRIHFGQRRADVFDADGVALRQQQHLARDIFQFAHVARPGLRLQKFNRVGSGWTDF